MKIYRMEATFGKLDRAKLELKPGLNLIHAPNEWGKSTWCVFILAMLYGLDTRAKSTKSALADKERYAPWSGKPMSGRMDLCWQGRDITIERSTRGRIPMGVFKAYETHTGLNIPELTAANCGEVLLGVEQSVFRRAGFLRLQELTVTQDEALRRRLNALVTTGDDSGDAEALESKLKDLKNRCRYNRTGLLPQAETECRALEDRLEELDGLREHCAGIRRRLSEERKHHQLLETHLAALDYADAELDAARVAQARDIRDRCARELTALDAQTLPDEALAEAKLRELRDYQRQLDDARAEELLLPPAPESPRENPVFAGLSPQACRDTVAADTARYHAAKSGTPSILTGLGTALALALALILGLRGQWLPMAMSLAAAVLLLVLAITTLGRRRKILTALKAKYAAPGPRDWQRLLDDHLRASQTYDRQVLSYRRRRGDLDRQLEALDQHRRSLCGSQSPDQVLELWQQILQQHRERRRLRESLDQAQRHLDTLQAMAKPARRPIAEDTLELSREETLDALSQSQHQQQRLMERLGQLQGRMDALGNSDALEQQLQAVRSRIRKLEQIYAAASLGLETLEASRRELQRRFAPRIASQARANLEQLTLGRYDRLILQEDLSLQAAAREEAVLRESLWRSDGTADQLALALRLAVAQVLTPEAPMVLDDALVRFDDDRLTAALKLLQEIAREKQVILFTCQNREATLLAEDTR